MTQSSHSGRIIWIVVALVLSAGLLLSCGLGLPELSGHVREEGSGDPIVGATIQIADRTTQTSETGTFSLRMPQGMYELSVAAVGYQDQVITATLPMANPGDPLQVRLQRRSLRGIVRRENGAVLDGVQVAMGKASSQSGSDGVFELDASELAALALTAECYEPLEIGEADLAALYDEAGRQTSELVVTLSPRFVQGVVTDSFTGEPVGGVAVQLGSESTETGPDGLYTLLACSMAGEMRFSATTHRPLEGLVYEGQEELDVALEPWWTLLQVVDAKSGVGLPGVLVESAAGYIETDDDGEVAVMVSPDTSLTFQLFGYRTAAFHYEGQEQIQVELEPVGLAGTLLDASTGRPVTRATVQAFEPGSDDPVLCYPDEEGRFLLEEPSEVERILVKAPGYRIETMSVMDKALVEIELEPFAAKGIYITFGRLADRARLEELLQLVDDTELNAVVIDVKSDRAWLAWPSEVPLAIEAGAYQANLMDLEEFVRLCRERDIYVIARMVIFKDEMLARIRPEWAVKWANGTLYKDFEGLAWMDPFRQEVRDYNLALTMEVAAMGFDEIQYDYIRFPSDGVRGVVYSQESNADSRTEAIVEMTRQAYEALAKTPVFFSVDIFGLTPWVEPPADMGIGQRVADMAEYADYVSPMLYPTTFTRGNLGYEVPGNHPYEVVYRSVVRCYDRSDTLVRPWIQAYSIGSFQYGPIEQLLQIRASEEAGASGWLFWHAGTRYDASVFAADAWERYPEAGGPPKLPAD